MFSSSRVRTIFLLAVMAFLIGPVAACGPLPPAAGPGVSDPAFGGGDLSNGTSMPSHSDNISGDTSPRLDPPARPATTPTAISPTPAGQSSPVPAAPTVDEAEPAADLPGDQMTPDEAQPDANESTATPSDPETNTGERIHIVAAGENLYRIGLQYGLSWVAIADYNGLADPDQISVGQELRIPPSPTVTPEIATPEAAIPTRPDDTVGIRTITM